MQKDSMLKLIRRKWSGMAVLVSNKVDFKAKNVTKDIYFLK